MSDTKNKIANDILQEFADLSLQITYAKKKLDLFKASFGVHDPVYKKLSEAATAASEAAKFDDSRYRDCI